MARVGNDRVDVIIPVYHPDKKLLHLLDMLSNQTVLPETVYLLNTETGKAADSCEELKRKIIEFFRKKKKFGTGIPLSITVIPVKKEEFDHGGTRQRAAEMTKSPFFLFMTQDAVPADSVLIEELLWSMEQGVEVSFARQLAAPSAGVLECYTRLFQYPNVSGVRTKEDIERLGIKAFFCSNVCAMYRRDRFNELGGFVRKTIFNEDMIYASKVLQHGGSVAYCAKAKVYHSHSYTWKEQFHRNFDLGVSQAEYSACFSKVSSETEGIRFAKSMLCFLWSQKYYMEIVDFIGECAFKYAGYLLGKHFRWLPKEWILCCTSNQEYWKQEKHNEKTGKTGKTEKAGNSGKTEKAGKSEKSGKADEFYGGTASV